MADKKRDRSKRRSRKKEVDTEKKTGKKEEKPAKTKKELKVSKTKQAGKKDSKSKKDSARKDEKKDSARKDEKSEKTKTKKNKKDGETSGRKESGKKEKGKQKEQPEKELDDLLVQTPIAKEIQWDGKSEASALFSTQREVMLLLLESRAVMNNIIKRNWEKHQEKVRLRRERQHQRRKDEGILSITEIQNVLKMQLDDEDQDCVSEIQELKRQLVMEIRRNHVLDRKVKNLDKRIGLLISNRSNIQQALHGMDKKKKRRKGQDEERPAFDLSKDPKKLDYYQELFYLLQTQPRYLAKCVYMVQAESMDDFLDTTILTLYGDAFSPREEFLILQLFRMAITNELAKIKSLSDFLKGTTVVPKMVITYNRRKQGLEYLKKTLGAVLKKVMDKKDLSFELHPMAIYYNMINELEIKTGEKSTLDRNISEEQAMEHPEVKATMSKRFDALREICQLFLDAVINSMNNLPYGIRWICKQIKEIAQERFGSNLAGDQVLKITGYFVYYRFINLAIVTPDAYNVIDKELDPIVRRNLVVVGKVLQNLFNFRCFNNNEKHMIALNSFIEKNKPVVEHYFNSLVKVDDPEDHLSVNKYNELTQKTKPVILISLHEISSTHNLLLEHLDDLAPEKDDELRQILKDLGDPPPAVNEEEDREIQLTLTNRFHVEVEEDDAIERMYLETKELIIPILRAIPVETSIHRLHLTDVLESGIRHAGKTKNSQLSGQINKVLENIAKLEQAGRLSKSDRYESFVHDISLEVANRAAIREQQKREIQRLSKTLTELRKYQGYVEDQITQYEEYLQTARQKHYEPVKPKKKKFRRGKKDDKKTMVGPFKFSYKELQKTGVIIESDVPQISRKKTQFLISSDEVGVFLVTAKIAGFSVESMKIELDDLLERHYNGVQVLELEQVTLDVNMTIHLINKFFMGKK
eukprot:TRINITY_DN175_c0_g1_i1.p1 TRINITY_DN175_c0_g1~~TRINITY_DN175_c0_g1_i1.p1  ORF type:complete len:924 (-),score=207.35 TRINITY_DN175_c0_g1_i1:100-2871(-)